MECFVAIFVEKFNVYFLACIYFDFEIIFVIFKILTIIIHQTNQNFNCNWTIVIHQTSQKIEVIFVIFMPRHRAL